MKWKAYILVLVALIFGVNAWAQQEVVVRGPSRTQLGQPIPVSIPGGVTFAGAVTTETNIQVNTVAAGVTFPSTQSGTWTVQPGNTANTTAWLVTGTGGVFPATQSGTWTVQPGNTANTTPWLFAWQDKTNANYATVLSDGSVKVTMMNATEYDTHPTNTAAAPLFVKGWPIYSTNQQFNVYPGAITNGNALASVLEFDNIASDVNSPSLLLCATYICNTNCPLIAKVTAHFFSAAPTALGANGEVLTTFADNTNYLGALQFTNWTRLGTNMVCTVPGQNIGAGNGNPCATNWVIVTAENTWTNNAGLPKDTLKLTYQKAY